MTDRELLELAAKAAGLDDAEWIPGKGDMPGCILTARLPGFRCFWHPLTDDGDSLRLAVKLGIARVLEMEVGPAGICVTFHHPDVQADEFQKPGADFDPYAATRRAIVRAAAEIGRQMP